MAEAPRTWRDIRLGVAVVALLVLALFVRWVTRGHNPFVEGYTLTMYVQDAQGLQEGSPVLLSGIWIGEVERIDILDLEARRRAQEIEGLETPNIRIVLGVDDLFRTQITNRSAARIAPRGASGAKYVRIVKGRVGGRPLRTGERVATLPALDFDFMLARGRRLVAGVESLNRHTAQVGLKLRAGGGSLGRFLQDPSDNEVAENWEDMNASAARVLRVMDEGRGILALERRSGRIRANLAALRAAADSIAARLDRREGTLGAFAADTALPSAIARLQATSARVEAKLDRGEGSLGRFMNDPELFRQIDVLRSQLDSLAAQVIEDPLGSVDVDLY
ncbi:MAG: MlaD family protein [Gemmatimonadota bacterium]